MIMKDFFTEIAVEALLIPQEDQITVLKCNLDKSEIPSQLSKQIKFYANLLQT